MYMILSLILFPALGLKASRAAGAAVLLVCCEKGQCSVTTLQLQKGTDGIASSGWEIPGNLGGGA